MKRFGAACFVASVVCANGAAGQSISIDGSTVTGVTTRPGGAVEIAIAPPAGGVSHNSFQTFNVEAPGVDFDNQGIGAAAIVAEVTGPTRSNVVGQVQVLGDRADFVLVNPNGISVNGARFNNIRGLSLIAGRSAATGVGAPLRFDVSDAGDVEIGAQGLVANVRRLDIAAKTLSFAGPVTEDSAVPFVRIEAHAGPGSVEIDPSVFSTDDPGYFNLTNRGNAQSGTALTVSSGALLSGGSVTLRADGRGAGVVMNGRGLASVGEFTLDASGAVRMKNGSVQAQSDVVVTSGALTVDGASLKSDTGNISVTVNDGNADVAGLSVDTLGRFRVASPGDLRFSNFDVDTTAALSLTAGGTLALNASRLETTSAIDIDARRISLASTAQDRAAIISSADRVSLSVTDDVTSDGGLIQGQSVSIEANDLVLNTLSESQIASVVSQGGDVDVDLRADFASASGRLLSAGDLTLNTGGTVRNTVARVGQPGISRRGRSNRFFGTERKTFDAGRPLAGREIGQIGADGTLTVSAGGDIRNIGGNIFGASITLEGTTIVNQLERFGLMETSRRCFAFFCRGSVSGAFEFDGGEIETNGILRLTARSGFENIGGLLRGDGGLRLSGPQFAFRPLLYPNAYRRPGGFSGLFGGAHIRSFQDFEAGFIVSLSGDLQHDDDTRITIDGVPFFPNDLVDTNALASFSLTPSGLAASNRDRIGVFSTVLE